MSYNICLHICLHIYKNPITLYIYLKLYAETTNFKFRICRVSQYRKNETIIHCIYNVHWRNDTVTSWYRRYMFFLASGVIKVDFHWRPQWSPYRRSLQGSWFYKNIIKQ